MNKLLQAFETRTLERVAIFPPISISETREPIGILYRRYRVMATLGAEVICNDEQVVYAERQVKRQLVEHLFGEFKQDLIDAQVAAFKQDYTLVNQKIDSVLERMFTV